MAPTRRQFLGAATASAVAGLSGCPSDGGTGTPTDAPESTPESTDTPMETAAPTEAGPSAASVAVRSHPDHGDILVDGEGRTLYMFDSDTQGAGSSTCSGDCAEAWPPLSTASEPAAGDGVTATLSTFERGDGSTQVAANGWPLYYFANDESPGDANGQGVGDVWWVLGPDGTPKRPEPARVAVRSHPDHGDVLVDGDGMTLYLFDDDSTDPPSSACSGGCADSWPPHTSPVSPEAGDAVTASIGTFERADGANQVTAEGWPLYTYSGDSAPGEATGQGVNDAWWVLDPSGSPQRNFDVSGGGGGSGGGY